MSTTIDQRVVEMQFDNKQFERNVSTTMSTLDSLKQSLNMTGAAKGFEGINAAAKGVSFAGIGSGIEAIQAKFSALQVMGITALTRITNSAIDAGKRITSALTIDPIKTGFSEYETQINAVQTILANTQSKGTTIGDVNKALDELNTYADKTIYNFTEMTRNIGTFTAAGVDLDKSVTSIKGIANLAAVSGSTSQQASTAMYQLSQALAAGKVSLMDWNSVVNAGMGGEVFQNALKRTAENMGTNVDAMIEKYGSFRESLTQGEWLTADVLTETLTQLSGAYSKADLIAQGYSEKQAKEIMELAKTAESAATDVKTFTQLWDTLKESAQSGWTQTWELIVGDFEEAKALLSEISSVLNGIIGESAESRNKMVSTWKDLGGRTALIEGMRGAFEALTSVIKPIKEAFRSIFPDDAEAKGKKLYNLTMDIAVFLKKLKLSDTASENLKKTFEGIFAVVDIGLEVFKALAKGVGSIFGIFDGLGGGILETTASIGEWLVTLRDSIKEGNTFGETVDKIANVIKNAIGSFKNFAKSVKDSLTLKDYEGFASILEYIWDLIKKIGSIAGNVFTAIGDSLGEAFGGSDLGDAVSSAAFGGILVGLYKLIQNLGNPLEALKEMFEGLTGEGGVFENVKGILEDVRDTFKSYQDSLQAETLKKIAVAIGILAAAIFVISTIDAASLGNALGAITVLFTELLVGLSTFSKMTGSGIGGAVKSMGLMTTMSVSILILAGALKILGSLNPQQIMQGLGAIGGLMFELSVFLEKAKFDGKIMGTAGGIVLLSTAMLILAKAVEDFGSMNWGEIGKGLVSVGVLLGELGMFTKFASGSSNMISVGVGMIALGAAMKIFASAVSDFATMNLGELGTGLLGMAGALGAVTLALNFMPKNMISTGVGLLAVAGAMTILAGVMQNLGTMSWGELGVALGGISGSLAILAIALTAMNGTLAGSAALIVAAGALAILAPVLERLGQLTWSEIGMGLVAIAGAFAAVGLAGALLTPLVPTIVGLAGAFALFGVAILGIGAGITLIGVGLSALAAGITAVAVSGAANATAFVAALSIIITGVADLIPTVITKLGEGIVAFCKVIGDSAAAIGKAFAQVVTALVVDVLGAIADNSPKIVESVIEIIMACLNGIADHISEFIQAGVDIVINLIDGITQKLPDIIQAGFDLVVSFINGVANALRDNTPVVMDAMSNLFSACIEAAVGIIFGGVGMFVDGGIALVKGIIDGVVSLYSKIKSSFTDLVNKGKTAISNKVSEFKTIGKNLIQGLIDGVKNKASSLVTAAKGVVNNAIDAAKKLLKINSPSKVFVSFGESMDEGLIVGLNNWSSKVVSATKDVGNQAISGMRGIISTIGDALNSDIDVQPTIRPVLDLSEVTAGAKNINGMLDMAPSVGVLANVGAIAYSMNTRGQNGTDGDVVSAIRDLGRRMAGMSGDTYNINGVTYDDGSNINDAVRTLVRAARVERRR